MEILAQGRRGTVLAAILREWDWPGRPGLSEAAEDLIAYLEGHAHRMEYPEYLGAAGASAVAPWRAHARPWWANA